MEKPVVTPLKKKLGSAKTKTGASSGEGLLTAQEARELYARLAAANPDPQTELEYVNPFTLLVAVALSAQATDVGVNKATRSLFAKVDTPQKMLDLGEERLARGHKDHRPFQYEGQECHCAL